MAMLSSVSGFYLWFVLATSYFTAADVDLKVFDASGKEIASETLIPALRTKRVVFIGENHDRYDNHLDELEIVRRLHEIEPRRGALGVEFRSEEHTSELQSHPFISY